MEQISVHHRCGIRRDEALRRIARRSVTVSLAAVLSVVAPAFVEMGASAQELEPRSYANAPIGLNFLIAGYVFTDGNVAFDPSTPITGAKLHTHSAVVAYARSLSAWGNSAKFDVIVPHTWLAGSALVNGQPAEREVSGFADPKFRFSMNFYGAPALSLKEFADYRQDLVVGASVQASVPLGRYDASKIVNLGTNRWSAKTELGISKAWGPWTAEIAPSFTLYSDNKDFLDGGTVAQAPLYAVQGHLIHSFRSGIWVALDTTYYAGGRTTVNGVQQDTRQSNTRTGLTVALPVDRYNSVKFYASTGVSTRTGSDFDAIGVAWQHRWGGGL